MMQSYGCVLITNKNGLLCSKLSKSSREKCFKNKITHSVRAELFLSIVVVIVVHFQLKSWVLWMRNFCGKIIKILSISFSQCMSTLLSHCLPLLKHLREFAHKLEMFFENFSVSFSLFLKIQENLSFEFISNYLVSTEICIHIRTVELKCMKYFASNWWKSSTDVASTAL